MTEPYEDDRIVETPESLRDRDTEAPGGDRGSGAEDHPLGAEKFGTTHAEAEEGESLDQRLAEEEPDGDGHDPVDDVVADDPATFGDGDQSDDEVLGDAYGAGTDADLDDERRDGDLSAEEAALRVEE